MFSRPVTFQTLLFLSLLVLSGCVIKSRNEIISNEQSEIMLGGARHLLWITHDNESILLERFQKELERTYFASSLSDPSENVIVRFYKWSGAELVPNEDTFIVAAVTTNKKNREYYYQLLSFDPSKSVWTTWSYTPPDDKEIIVSDLKELKNAFKTMVEKKYFQRKELLCFRIAHDTIVVEKSSEMPSESAH
ncbi:MAG: hypothetical protein IPH06_03320 [Alphaproteobacteria bacterium]|nr:hypothetical protein [Alphaproteobacteria bacterium]QQS57069.1 MAG: hypothetical protein IPN28_12570 [Alphaproteobacteria bacterium]